MTQTRRTFLKTAALALGAVAMTQIPAEGQIRKRPTRFGIVRRGGSPCLRLRFFPYELRLRDTFAVAGYSRDSTPGVQVEVSYDGFMGYGEASMPPYLGHTVSQAVEFLRRVDLEQFADPLCLEDILDYVDGLTPGCQPAKAAVDIALHDLAGKLLDAPLHRIWGLDPLKAPSTTFTIGIASPDEVRRKTAKAAPRFNLLKVKLGGGNDHEMIRAVRSVTSLPLAIDANQGWTDRRQALDTIAWLKEEGALMVEQPLPKERMDDIAWITQHSPLPIYADEAVQGVDDVLRVKGAYTGVNIKLMKCGGLRQARRMLTLARTQGMRVMIGCMTETSCAVSAAAQLSPAMDFADLDGNLLISNDRFCGVQVKDGRLVLPSLPGIGVERI